MIRAYLNRLAVAVPEHEVHGTFVRFAERALRDRRSRLLFDRMVSRSEIRQRWSCLVPASPGCNKSPDADGFYTLGSFPSTAARMRRYERMRRRSPRKPSSGLTLAIARSKSRTSSSHPARDYPPPASTLK